MDDILIRFRLTGDEAKALKRFSAESLRHPRNQVRWLVRQKLEEIDYLQSKDRHNQILSAPATDKKGA